MHKPTSYKSKQFLSPLIKLSIVFITCYFIYYKLTHNEQLNIATLWETLQQKTLINPINYIVLILLSIFNWYFEILKWKITVSSIKKISFYEAAKQSLGALTASLLTPNKIGEYGAKAIFFEKVNRKKIIFLNLIHNLSQLTATLVYGSIGSCFFFITYKPTISYSTSHLWILILFIIGLFLLIGFWKNKFKGQRVSIDRLKGFLKKIPSEIRFKILGLSFLRYLIFSHQFYFLMHLFNVEIDYKLLMIGISSIYFLSAALPVLFLFDVVIKGGVALWVFSFIGVNELAILTIILLMWILNFVFPSLIGSYFILNFKTSNHLKAIENS